MKQQQPPTQPAQTSGSTLRLFIESTPAAIAVFDRDMRYLMTSRRFRSDYKLPDDLTGRSHYDVFPDIPERWKQIHLRCLTGESESAREDPFLHEDGTTDWIRWDIQPWYLENDVIGGIILFTELITERKQAERDLRHFESIASCTTDLQALLDKNYVYLAANSAYLKATDKTHDTLINKTVTEVFGVDFFNNIIKPHADLCLTGANICYQDWFDLAIGHKFMDVAYAPHFAADKTIQGFVVTARDITEQQNLHAQLLQAQKMESVGLLAGGVAHDYNNMLNIIIGYTELAQHKLKPSDPIHADLQQVMKAANRSTIITRQLLTFARKQTINPIVIDLNECVDNTLQMLRRLIGEDISLIWRPGKAIGQIEIDPSQLEQILANLCVNARDAIDGIGNINIETSLVTLDDDFCVDHIDFIPGEFVVIAVSDDGNGIDRATLENIFEPFFTTKDLDKGTGLGLAMVYGIVKQNCGFINVYSEPEVGTTFRIYLPRFIGVASELVTEIPCDTPARHGETLLLVEDEPAIRDMTQRMLELLGYQVLTADSPDIALQIAGRHNSLIQLLITDVVMPQMNGRDLADKLVAEQPKMKILFMSGYTADVIARRGVLEANTNFIQKPFTMKDLGNKVHAILGSQ